MCFQTNINNIEVYFWFLKMFGVEQLDNRLIMALLLLAGACGSPPREAAPDAVPSVLNPDTTVRPAADFYRFANHYWMQTAPIPAGYQAWTIYHELEHTNRQQLLEIMQRVPENPRYPEGSGIRKAWYMFQVGMDSVRAERLGLRPLRPLLNAIASIRTPADLLTYLKEDYFWVPPFFQCTPSGDGRATLTPAGLGLPDLQDYLALDAEARSTRQQYVAMMEQFFRLAGQSESAAQADAWEVWEVESALARAWLQTDDVPRSYFRWTELDQISSGFSWSAWKAATNLPAEWVFTSRAEMAALDRIFDLPLDRLKSYLKGQLLRKAAPFLTVGFQQAHADFYPTNPFDATRMHRVLRVVNETFADAVGRVYVQQYASNDGLLQAQALAANIRLALADRIKALPIADSLKVEPLARLQDLTVHVGYPDTWRRYTALVHEKDTARISWVGYVMQARKFQYQELWRPPMPGEWNTPAQSTQLVYEEATHTLTIPAGFLQHPVWHQKADVPAQYGLCGTEVARALVPLFQGVFHPVLAPFRQAIQRGPRGADEQEKAALWETESVALHVALEAWRRYQRENPAYRSTSRWTPEQQFFIAWAALWRTKHLQPPDEHLFQDWMKPLFYCDSFYEAFAVQTTDAAFVAPQQRLVFW